MNMPSSSEAAAPKNGRLNQLFAEYGSVFIAIYMGIFGIVLVSFAWAIQWGLGDTVERWAREIGGWVPWLSDDAETAGTAGTWAAAYVAAKLMQPVRIAVAAALTAIVHRLRKRRGDSGASPAPRSEP